MPALTRRRNPEAPNECWQVFMVTSRVGTIALRTETAATARWWADHHGNTGKPVQDKRHTIGVGMDYKGLRALLVVHGFITTAAGVVLTVAPSLIPGVVGIRLEPSAYVLAYLLAGAEFGLAVLSFGGSRLTDSRALRLTAWSCIAFHGSSGVLEAYAYAHGASVAILGNVAARAVVVGLFAHLSRDRP